MRKIQAGAAVSELSGIGRLADGERQRRPGRAPDLALRIEVEIPDRKMSVSLLLRRNMDASFPASHTLEIQFNSPAIRSADFQRARNAGEERRGRERIGADPERAGEIKEGDILFALPDTQLEQNIQLLRERPWFDIAFFYNNGRRGVLAFEKGTPGERAINDALAAWGRAAEGRCYPFGWSPNLSENRPLFDHAHFKVGMIFSENRFHFSGSCPLVRRQSRRCLDLVHAAHYRFLYFLEGAHFDLTHALA